MNQQTITLSVADLLKLACDRTRKHTTSNAAGSFTVSVKDGDWSLTERRELWRIFEQASGRRYGVTGFEDGCALCGHGAPPTFDAPTIPEAG